MLKYVEIEEFIMKNIKNGTYLPNEKILSENQLASKFGTSRMTARKAIDNLVSRNYLYKIMGKGTFVVDRDEKIPVYLNEMIGFKNRTLKSGRVPTTKVLKFIVKKPNYVTAKIMNISKNNDIYYIERVRFLDGKPVVLEITYMPTNIFNDLTKEELEKSKYDYIRSKGYDICKMEKEYSAIIPEKKFKKF
ncbi:MAG: hypothetical protein PWP46_1994 [Fusobacteriaceae bacterium]|nr:hypothetical protein [Fusobacteriaceae bacterium]